MHTSVFFAIDLGVGSGCIGEGCFLSWLYSVCVAWLSGDRVMALCVALHRHKSSQTPAFPDLKTSLLGVLPDEQDELQIGESRKHALAPQFGAFATWRQVAAFGVKAWETEAHSHDGDDLRIVENLLPDSEPAA